jgi:hypothetical protein
VSVAGDWKGCLPLKLSDFLRFFGGQDGFFWNHGVLRAKLESIGIIWSRKIVRDGKGWKECERIIETTMRPPSCGVLQGIVSMVA